MTIAILIGGLVILAAAAYFVFFAKSDPRGSENDARSFARLLVTEIKLYESRKIEEGLMNNNLYEVLSERIENARELYRQKVTNPEFEKFFDDALVELLAGGEPQKLGKTVAPRIS